MEDNEQLKKEMSIVLIDLRKTKNITFTSENTNIHLSKIYNWISNGKNFHVEPFYSFYLEYEKIVGNSNGMQKKSKMHKQKKENHISRINEELEKLSLDDFYNNDIYEFDKNLSVSENIVRKFVMKKKGMELEQDKNYDSAIDYYKLILNNSYFVSDYYVYRRLSMLYERKNQPYNHLNIIKEFFKSDIYASEYQIRWMVHKLFRLEESGYIDKTEVDNLILYYDEHGSTKKDLENYPVVLAERIYEKNDGTITIKTQKKYEKQQRKYELKEIGAELERNEEYEEALGFYWELVEKNVNGATDFYKRLVYIYDKREEYENELYVLSLFYKKKFRIVGSNTKKEFEKKLNKVNRNLETNYSINDLINEEFGRDDKNQSEDKLLRYADLYEDGKLTQEEYNLLKKEYFSKLSSKISVEKKNYSSKNNFNINSKEINELSHEIIITVGRTNFSTLLKSDIGDGIFVQIVNQPNRFTKLQIVDIQNQNKSKKSTRGVIKISEENFEVIENLKSDELITIKSKGRRGKVILKRLDYNEESFKQEVNKKIDNVQMMKIMSFQNLK